MLVVTALALLPFAIGDDTVSSEPIAAGCSHRIEGVVTDAATGEALPRAEIEVKARSKKRRRVTSDERGIFVITELCPGNAVVAARRADYEPVERALRIPDSPMLTLALTPRRLTRLDDVIVVAPTGFDGDGVPFGSALNEEDLQRMRGRSLAATLAEVPGVTVLEAGPQAAKPVVRGQFGRRILTLFDGVRHEAQDWGIDHAPELDPFSAGRMSVVKGAAGVRYGPDAIGGVILIEPRALRLTPGVDGEVHLVGVDNGRRGTFASRVDVAPQWLPGLSFRIENSGFKSASISTPDIVLGNTASETVNMGGVVGYAGEVFGQALDARLSLRHHRARIGVCYCISNSTPADLAAQRQFGQPVSTDVWTTTYDIDRAYQAVSHTTALAKVSQELGVFGRVEAAYSFQLDIRQEFDSARQSITGPQFDFNLGSHFGEAVYAHPPITLGSVEITGSAGLQTTYQENRYKGLRLIPNYRRWTSGIFAIERVALRTEHFGDVQLEVGARYDQLVQTAFLRDVAYTTQVRRGRLDENQCEDRGTSAACEKILPAFSLTTGASWTRDLAIWSDALVLRADAGTASRFPDVDELYLGGRAPSFPVFALGDAGLENETTYQTSLSTEIRLPFFVAEASGFASYIDNYIAFGPQIGPSGEPVVDVLVQGAFPRFSFAATDALFYGVDGNAVLAPEEIFSLSTQVAFVEGANLTTGGYLPFVPPPRARLELISNMPALASWHMSSAAVLRSTFVARQTRSDETTDFAPAPAAYMLFGAEVRSSFVYGDRRLHASLEARNLLNQRTRDYMSLLRYYVDQPGREFWLRLSADFG